MTVLRSVDCLTSVPFIPVRRNMSTVKQSVFNCYSVLETWPIESGVLSLALELDSVFWSRL